MPPQTRERLRRALPWVLTFLAASFYATTLAHGGFGYSTETRPMPKLSAARIDDGRVVSDVSLRSAGQPVILNVWAPSCPPCRHELPGLDELAAEYDGRVQFLGLMSWGSTADAKAIAQSDGLNHLPLLAGGEDFLNALDVESVPTTFFIRADGTIIARQVGMRSKDFFRTQADKLLAGKP